MKNLNQKLRAFSPIILIVISSFFGQTAIANALSPVSIAVTPNRELLFAAQTTAQRIDVLDVAKGHLTATIPLPQNPTGLAMSPDGKRLFATGDGPGGLLFEIDVQKMKVVRSLVIGHTPMSPVIDSRTNTLYCTVRFDNAVAVIDLDKNKAVATIPMQREPIACTLTADGKTLFVANHLPVGRADTDDIAACIEAVDTAAKSVVASIRLPNGSSSLRGLCISPDGQFVYVTHLLSRYTMPTTQLERGWMNTNAFSILDTTKKEWVNTVLLDELTEGAANPWAIACTADGKTLCITHAGTHEVSLVDRVGLHAKLDQWRNKKNGDTHDLTFNDIPHILSFLDTLRIRYALKILGPRGCAAVDSHLYVTGYFSDAVEVIDLSKNQPVSRIIAFGDFPQLDKVRRGELAFNDAAFCFQKWQSCASCHPDGRVDSLNWDLLNDGIGNPKNNRSMLYTHFTPPVMISGIRPDAETAVRAGFRFIQFVNVSEETAVAVDEYLKTLKPTPSPYLVNGKLSPSAQRGKKVFEKADCSRCHYGDYYTDGKRYDVGLGPDQRGITEFVTPTLIEVWRTAPYLFDGRAATIEDVFMLYNPDDRHGKTSELSRQEMDDLIEYILSL